MNYRLQLALFLFFGCTQAFAATGKINIWSPLSGEEVSTKHKVPISYESILGSDGDHLHLYVDGKRVDILREKNGTAEVGPLALGKHHICLEENTKAHVSTGVQTCVDVVSKEVVSR